jgi:uncharacterized ferredoxin-like protein
VGGPLSAENSFVARSRLLTLVKPITPERDGVDADIEKVWDRPVVYRPVMKLGSNMKQAMDMMMRIDALTEQLPGLDCGSCGSPSCACFAEDVVKGYASIDDCIFRLKEKMLELKRKYDELKHEEK